MIDRQDLENRFTYHPIDSEGAALIHEAIRRTALRFAQELVDHCPQSRELSLAITALEEVVCWANASVARHNSDGSRRRMGDGGE